MRGWIVILYEFNISTSFVVDAACLLLLLLFLLILLLVLLLQVLFPVILDLSLLFVWSHGQNFCTLSH